MLDLHTVSSNPNEVIEFLKKNLQLKETSQNILHQKIIEKAAQDRGITVTPEEIQAAAEQWRYANRLEKAADTLAWLASQMIAPDDWEAGIRDRLLAQKLAEHLFAQEAEKVFIQNKLDFEQVLLYQIVVPYEQIAQELFYQIEEEEIDFYHAAHLYDIAPKRRQQCGYEGTICRWNLKPEIAAIVFSAPIGKAIGPVKTEQGYHLLRVEEFIPASLTPEKRQEIIDKLFQGWLASELNYMLHNQS